MAKPEKPKKLTPEQRAQAWVNHRKPTPDQGDFLAVGGKMVLGPFHTDDEAMQKAYEKSKATAWHIMQISQLGKPAPVDVIASPVTIEATTISQRARGGK